MARIRDALVAVQPDFVYLGLPFPKASALAGMLRRAAAHMVPGPGDQLQLRLRRRGPRPQLDAEGRTGVDAPTRQEPRRLARRYSPGGLPFVLRLLWTSLSRAPRGRGQQRDAPSTLASAR